MERMTGVEPAYSAWEADVLPMNYIRTNLLKHYNILFSFFQGENDLFGRKMPFYSGKFAKKC